MKDANQPQTTKTPTSRDAAAQISLPDHLREKARLILEGVMKANGVKPIERYMPTGHAIYDLAEILAQLTSSKKADRDEAKNMVRYLVKIGTEAIK